MRVSFNPTARWALQVSRGRIKSPEELHADADVDRTTASVMYQRQFGAVDTQTTLAWGRNAPTQGEATSVVLLESAGGLASRQKIVGRDESAEKGESLLSGDPHANEKFRVGKLSVGYIYDLPPEGHWRFGIGGLVSRYAIPTELSAVYGNPTSFMLFARLKII